MNWKFRTFQLYELKMNLIFYFQFKESLPPHHVILFSIIGYNVPWVFMWYYYLALFRIISLIDDYLIGHLPIDQLIVNQ